MSDATDDASLESLLGAYAERQQRAFPERLGDYRIVREIGRGGMGIVYEAEQLSLGRRVALKVLPGHAALDTVAVERFEREARAAAQLHHTNIVPVFEVGRAGDVVFYAMQFIDGRPLDRVIAGWRRGEGVPPASPAGPLPATVAEAPPPVAPATDPTPTPVGPGRARAAWIAGVVLQAAEALAYAHTRGVVHRDIKPGNLLLDGRGTVWVADFGLAFRPEARARGEEGDLTATGQVVGTLRYLAPERFQGACDSRADIYALGLTLYELLTLQPAFPAADPLALVEQIKTTAPTRPRAADPSLPRDLETVALKAIEKDPNRRYQHASELADDLRRFLADEPVQARRVGPAELAARWCRRNPLVTALLAASLLGLLGTGVMWLRAVANAQEARDFAGKLDAEKKAVEVERDNVRAANDALVWKSYLADIREAQAAAEAGAAPRVRRLLDAHHPQSGERDRRGFEWHYLDRLALGVALTLPDHGGPVFSVAYAADGRTLAAAANGPIHLWDAGDGRLLRTLKGHKGNVRRLAFSRDGKNLLSAGDDGAMRLWDLAMDKETRAIQAIPSPIYDVALSPDGSRLARGTPSGDITIYNVTDGAEVRSFRAHGSVVLCVAFSPDGTRLASGGGDMTVKLWDMATGKEVRTLPGHRLAVRGVAFSPDGTRLASTGDDPVLKIWNVAQGAEVATFVFGEQPVFGVAWAPDNARVAAASAAGIAVWDVVSRRLVFVRRPAEEWTQAVAWSPDGNRLAAGVANGSALVWDLPPRPVPPTEPRARLLPLRGAVSPDGTRFAGLSAKDRTVVLVSDVALREQFHSLEGHKGEVTAVAFSPDGSRLATASMDATVLLWDAQSGKPWTTLRGHEHGLRGVAFSADGSRLATVALDGTGRLWDAATGAELRTLPGGNRLLTGVAWSPDGRLVAAGAALEVVLWDVETGQEARSLTGHLGDVHAVAFHPGGARLVSASLDRTLKIWDVVSGQETLTLRGHGAGVTKVTFSADGERLLSADMGGDVKVWIGR